MEFRCEFIVNGRVVYAKYFGFIPHVGMTFEIEQNKVKIKEVIYDVSSGTVKLESKVL